MSLAAPWSRTLNKRVDHSQRSDVENPAGWRVVDLATARTCVCSRLGAVHVDPGRWKLAGGQSY